MKLIKDRLTNIMRQLSSDQNEELMEMLYEIPAFQPKGYPYKYTSKDFNDLTGEEIKHLHDRFIDIQYSDYPKLQGEDIREVLIYPYIIPKS